MLFFFYGFIRKRKEKMKLSEYLKIGTKMKILRKEKGISQKEMAEILEMIPSAYSNYEKILRYRWMQHERTDWI